MQAFQERTSYKLSQNCHMVLHTLNLKPYFVINVQHIEGGRQGETSKQNRSSWIRFCAVFYLWGFKHGLIYLHILIHKTPGIGR